MTSTFVGFTCGRFHVSGTTNGSIAGRFHHGDRYLNCGRSTDGPSHQFRSNILHPCNRLDQKSAKLSKLSSKNICLKNLTMTYQFPAIYGVSSKNNRSQHIVISAIKSRHRCEIPVGTWQPTGKTPLAGAIFCPVLGKKIQRWQIIPPNPTKRIHIAMKVKSYIYKQTNTCVYIYMNK